MTALMTTTQYFTQDQVDVLRKTVCPGNASEAEIKMFSMICEKTKLNPFTHEIYFANMGGRNVFMISIGGLRTMARRSGRFSAGREHEVLRDNKGSLAGVRAFLMYKGPTGWVEISDTALLSEYGKSGGCWTKMPETMLEKCATAKLIRRALVSDSSASTDALYLDEEMGRDRLYVEGIDNIETTRIVTATDEEFERVKIVEGPKTSIEVNEDEIDRLAGKVATELMADPELDAVIDPNEMAKYLGGLQLVLKSSIIQPIENLLANDRKKLLYTFARWQSKQHKAA